MVETLLAKIGLPLLINFVSSALQVIDNKAAKAAVGALSDVGEVIKTGGISEAQMIEANRHIETLAALKSEEIRSNIEAVNQSLRAEIASQDKYVRRMRPTFGYIMALTWAAQMLGIAYVMVFGPIRAGELLNAMSSLSAIWGIGLSVLGIYVYKRSEDKKYIAPPERVIWNSA